MTLYCNLCTTYSTNSAQKADPPTHYTNLLMNPSLVPDPMVWTSLLHYARCVRVENLFKYFKIQIKTSKIGMSVRHSHLKLSRSKEMVEEEKLWSMKTPSTKHETPWCTLQYRPPKCISIKMLLMEIQRAVEMAQHSSRAVPTTRQTRRIDRSSECEHMDWFAPADRWDIS